VQVASFILAVWGAGLSTALAAIGLLKDRRRLRLDVTYRVGPDANDSGRVVATMVIRVVNDGSRALRVEEAWVEWQQGATRKGNSFETNPLPKKIEPDEHVDVAVLMTDAERDPFRAVVKYNDGRIAAYQVSADERWIVQQNVDIVQRLNEGKKATGILPRPDRD
jgi:hypothetical protein